MEKTILSINIAYMKRLIDELPHGYFSGGGDKMFVYVYYDPKDPKVTRKKKRHLSIRSKRGCVFASGVERFLDIRRRLNALIIEWRKITSEPVPEAEEQLSGGSKGRVSLDMAVYDGADEYQNQKEFISVFKTDGKPYRSKNEAIAAEILSKLPDIEFKYETKVLLDGLGTVYPDFFIAMRAIGKGFYLEIQGNMDSEDAAIKALNKERAYIRNGYRDGIDVVFYKMNNDDINYDALRSLVESAIRINYEEAAGVRIKRKENTS